jgi:hypothetical protein
MVQNNLINEADRGTKKNRILMLVPATATHLGLFSDLSIREDTDVVEAGYRKIPRWLKAVRRINLSQKINNIIPLPFKNVWFNKIELKNRDYSGIVIIDGALNYISEQWFDKVRKNYPNIRIFLYLINSLEASSPSIKNIKRRIGLIRWDHVFTFDPVDASEYKYTYKGFCYYSKHSLETLQTNCSTASDAFFVGGLKGKREAMIRDVYEWLIKNSVNCDFRVMVYGRNVPSSGNGIRYFNNGWRPYSEVLAALSHTKCIIEILQKGQSGATLRYFEAVCYNKKLLSNNADIVNYPYYDPRYMKIFNNVEDIDIQWLKDDIKVEYNYKGDFSPNVFIDMIQQDYL